MSCNKSTEVKITTFINPHLFWIFEKENIEKRVALETKLSGIPHTLVRKPRLEQFVIVHNNTYKRAIIKDIGSDKYYCWLVDYGILYNADKVYTIPFGASKPLSMAKQAALNNVVCVKEVLGPVEKTLIESIQFTPGTIKLAKNHIKSSASVYFQCVREIDGIHIGTISLHDCNGDQYDLATLLIKEKLLSFNSNMFAQALEINANIDDENYLKYTRTMSPECAAVRENNCKDEAINYLTTKSVGRAISRRLPIQAASTELNKHQDLQKWVNATENGIAVDVDDSDTESKSDKLEISVGSSKTDIDNCLELSDSVSVTAKLSPTSLEKLREIKNRHFSKNASRSVTSGQFLLDKSTDTTDASINVTIDSDTQSSGSFDSTRKPSFEPVTSSPIGKTLETSVESESVVKGHVSPKGKALSWGDFDNESEKKSKQPSLLNITPAGASYTSLTYKKHTPIKGSNPTNVAQHEKVFKSSSSIISNADSNHTGNDIRNLIHSIDPNVICLCSDCEKWNTEDGRGIQQKNVTKEALPECQPKKITKPPLLLKTETEKNDVVEMRTFTDEIKYRSAKMTEPNIIVHGTICPKPVHSINEIPFNPAVHHVLRTFDQVYSIQSYIWPSLMRKMNVCVVNSAKSGKTMGYLPVMCTYLLERNDRYADLPTNTISPIVVILCPGTSVADLIYDLAVKVMDEAYNRPVIALAIPPMDKTCLNQFQKQCDLLITTPIMLINLLHARIITAKRVCHLILEHSDVLLEKFPKEMESIFTVMNTMLIHRNCNHSIQLVSISESWTVPLENLLKQLQYPPLICIGAHLEAALYGRVDLQIHFLESQAKKQKLCDIIEHQYDTCRTVIICNTDDQVEELKELLQIKGIKGVFVNGTLQQVEIEEIESKWLATIGGKHIVFVCTDEIYNTILRIINAVYLIHYYLPPTWTQFSSRFSSFSKQYNSPLNTNKQESWIRCKAHIFLDETCTKQYPKLIELLRRMGCQLTSKFHEYYEASIKAREQSRLLLKTPLCPKLKQFGFCAYLKCKKRHTFSPELDYANTLPKNGTVKFEILHYRSVTSYTVKLLEHTDFDGNLHNCIKHPNLQNNLLGAMQGEKNGVYDAKINTYYVYYSNKEEIYFRCIVKRILRMERITKTATTVIVRLIDAGCDRKACVADLYEMPEEFKVIPAEAVEVYIANLVPPDLDEHYSMYSKKKSEGLIRAALKNGMPYCSGQIVLQLGNALWLKNMYVMEDLHTLRTIATRLNISADLLRLNLANKSEAQLANLYKLCEEANIKLPNFTKPKIIRNNISEQIKPCWAFLGEDEYTEVYLITLQTPALFYVQIKKFYNLLEELEKDIQDAIVKPFYPTPLEIDVGNYYLAKDPDGPNFCRVKVISVKDGIAECFYVDYGDYDNVAVADIKFLSSEFIEKLPFQAIECRLYGVEPVYGDWESEPINIIDRYIYEPETDYFRTLYATTCNSEKSTTTDSQKYAILLIDAFSKKHTVLNRLLIDCGEAKNLEGENIDIEFVQAEVYDSSVERSNNNLIEAEYKDVQRLTPKNSGKDDNKPNGTENGVHGSNKSDCSDESYHSWDVELFNSDLWFKHLLGIKDRKIEFKSDDSLPLMRALPDPGFSTPNIEWSQNETQINLTILLSDLKKYDLRVLRSASLIFKAFYNEKEYQFHLQLFDKVTMGQQIPGGLCLKIILIKCQPGIWPRLTLNKERLRFLKYDFKYFDEPEEPEEPKKPILSFGPILEDGDELPGDNVMEYGSDCQSSSEDSVTYEDF